MEYRELDRAGLRQLPLAERENRVDIRRDAVPADARPAPTPPAEAAVLDETAARIRRARDNGRPVMLAFGAHTIKNGLGPVLIDLVERGWLTHLATNGAGIIHDWEFAYLGQSSEDVRANVAAGRFGLWEETGRLVNLALLVGAWEGRGYGEAVGAFIEEGGLRVPGTAELEAAVTAPGVPQPDRAAAAADLLTRLRACGIPAGRMQVEHPFRAYSVQAAAYRLGVPFTGHPMIGHDIIYTHPVSHGAAIGRAAERDFLRFAAGVARIEGGVYLSVGSAVMSPMIFEKSLSMARNLAQQEGRTIRDLFMAVVDLAPASWDWERDGEPPPDHAAYYLRYGKTFNRMGGVMRYLCLDNREFLLGLSARLR